VAGGCDGEGYVRNEAQTRSGDVAYGRDKHQDQDEDVEELFKDDGAEDDGGRGAQVVRVGEDAHDVADAQRQDVVGGERGHEDAGADFEVVAEGPRAAGHHLRPTDAPESVARGGEAEDAEDPGRMGDSQGDDLAEGDSAKGVPKKEDADEEARNRL